MTYLKNLKSLFLFVMLASVIVSCGKDDIDTATTVPGDIEVVNQTEQNPLLARSSSSENGLDLGCFTVVYSFSVVDSVGNSYEITNYQDLQDLEDDGISAVDFQYPLTIEFEEGETQEVESGQALAELFANCLPSDWNNDEFPAFLISEDNACFTFVYPVSVVDADGNTTVTNNDEEFIEAISEELQFFSFPLTVNGPDGEVEVVSGDDLFLTLVGCNELVVDPSWEGTPTYVCYELQFPFEFLMQDGTIEAVEVDADYWELAFSGNIAGFVYPFTLISEDGTEVVVASSEELTAAVAACDNVLTFDLFTLFFAASSDPVTGEKCLDINYPFEVNDISAGDGTIVTLTINNFSEFELLPGFDQGWVYQIPVYPYSVTMASNGDVVEINSLSDLVDAAEDCN